MYKNMAIGGIMAIMLIAGLVMAVPTPCPIALHIKTIPIESAYGLTVIIKDTNTNGVISQGGTIPNGEYGEVVIDVGAQASCGTFKAVIKECESNPACTRIVSSNPAGFTTWDISAVPIETACLVCEICPSDITPYSECDSCCVECEACKDVQLNWNEAISVIFGSIALMGAAGYGGVKIYRKRTGELATTHYHPGIQAYHDINTVHSKVKIRHPKGELAPKYEKDELGEWKYVG